MRETWLDDLQARLGRKTFRVSVQKPPLAFKHAAFTSRVFITALRVKTCLPSRKSSKSQSQVQVALFYWFAVYFTGLSVRRLIFRQNRVPCSKDLRIEKDLKTERAGFPFPAIYLHFALALFLDHFHVCCCVCCCCRSHGIADRFNVMSIFIYDITRTRNFH